MTNKRATVIAAGDPGLADAIADGISEGRARKELKRARAQLKQAEQERDLMKIGYARCLQEKTCATSMTYHFKQPGAVRRWLLIGWTLMLLLANRLTGEDM